jgi:hypothetical protein
LSHFLQVCQFLLDSLLLSFEIVGSQGVKVGWEIDNKS